MAQTGYTPLQIYSSSTASAAPAAGNLANSTLGSELAINITDGKLFYKDNAGVVQVIAWKTTPTTAGGTGLTSYTAGDLLYYATGTTLSKLAIGSAGNYLSSSGSAPQWSAPAALTKTDDTNVTLTLGGSASTALLNAASLTLGWTGQLSVARGGTGLSSVTSGYIPFGNSATALQTTSFLQYSNQQVLGVGYVPNAWKGGGFAENVGGIQICNPGAQNGEAAAWVCIGYDNEMHLVRGAYFNSSSQWIGLYANYAQDIYMDSGGNINFYSNAVGLNTAYTPTLRWQMKANGDFFVNAGAKSTLTGSFNNVGTAQSISIADTNGGYIVITGVQGGVGSSTWRLNFVKRGGSLAIGTADKAILTADPISSVTVSSNNISVTPLAANTYITYAIYYTPLGA